MGNIRSFGRAPLGRSDTDATTGWTEGKRWEIAWGELCWEGARWKRRQGGRRAVGNSLGRGLTVGKEQDGGRVLLGGSDASATTG